MLDKRLRTTYPKEYMYGMFTYILCVFPCFAVMIVFVLSIFCLPFCRFFFPDSRKFDEVKALCVADSMSTDPNIGS